jgi:ABC-type polysaccharide/polyol phosphate export permease
MQELVRGIWPAASLRELWEYRVLVRALVDRNLKLRYQRTILGVLWALLNPMLTTMVLVGVFQGILRIETPNYWAFLISGYFPWVFTLHTLGTAAGVVTGHANMSRSVRFPAEALVASAVSSRLVEFLIEMGLVIVVLAVFLHQQPMVSLVALPFVILLQVLLTTGIAMPIAALAVFFDDVQYLLTVVLMLLTLISPVYYPITYAPESIRGILAFNPFAGILTLYQTILYEGKLPPLELFASTAAMSVVIFVAGLAAFRWKRGYFAETV